MYVRWFNRVFVLTFVVFIFFWNFCTVQWTTSNRHKQAHVRSYSRTHTHTITSNMIYDSISSMHDWLCYGASICCCCFSFSFLFTLSIFSRCLFIIMIIWIQKSILKNWVSSIGGFFYSFRYLFSIHEVVFFLHLFVCLLLLLLL